MKIRKLKNGTLKCQSETLAESELINLLDFCLSPREKRGCGCQAGKNYIIIDTANYVIHMARLIKAKNNSAVTAECSSCRGTGRYM